MSVLPSAFKGIVFVITEQGEAELSPYNLYPSTPTSPTTHIVNREGNEIAQLKKHSSYSDELIVEKFQCIPNA